MSHGLINRDPINVSDNVKSYFTTENLCNANKEFSLVLKRICRNLVEILDGNGTYVCVPFVASGTGANEAILSNIEGKVLIIENGKYSQRIGNIAERLSLSLSVLSFDELELIDTNQIERVLKNDPEIRNIFVVHHETTTSLLAPLHEIGLLTHKYQKLLLVDAISTAGAHSLSLQDNNIAFCSVSADKCLGGLPGVSFVLAKTEEIKKLKGKSKSYYFDLYTQWEQSLNGSTPFTAAIQTFFAVDKAIQILMQEGIKTRVQRYKSLLSHLKNGLKQIGLKFVMLPENHTSNILTLMYLPSEIKYKDLHEDMFKRGYKIYTDEDSLNKGRFCLSIMGKNTDDDINKFLSNLEKSLKSLGYKQPSS